MATSVYLVLLSFCLCASILSFYYVCAYIWKERWKITCPCTVFRQGQSMPELLLILLKEDWTWSQKLVLFFLCTTVEWRQSNQKLPLPAMSNPRSKYNQNFRFESLPSNNRLCIDIYLHRIRWTRSQCWILWSKQLVYVLWSLWRQLIVLLQ